MALEELEEFFIQALVTVVKLRKEFTQCCCSELADICFRLEGELSSYLTLTRALQQLEQKEQDREYDASSRT